MAKVCPICGNTYKHLLSHILTYIQYDDNNAHKQLLNDQIIIAQKLYNDVEYNTKTHNKNYNLLLTYMDYTYIWYNILHLSKRTIHKKEERTYLNCPICNKHIAQVALNRHLCTEHLDIYNEQVKLIKQLFFDYNFCENTMDNYPEVILNYCTIMRIWQQTYTKEERFERAKKCNGVQVSKVIAGRVLSKEHRESLSKAQVEYQKNNLNHNDNKQFSVHGFRPDIEHYAYSTYEANIYRIFQKENKKYKKETENTFTIIYPDGSEHKYIIDICDIDGLFAEPGTYIEVKGYMDERSLTRINCFKEQYPQYKLIVIGKQEKYKNSYIYDIDYNKLEQQYKAIIPLWETKTNNIRTNPQYWNINDNINDANDANDINNNILNKQCPICNQIYNKSLYLHIKYYHKDIYNSLIYYINSLFYDINFNRASINQYRHKLYDIGYTTIYNLWIKKYGKNIVAQRMKILKK